MDNLSKINQKFLLVPKLLYFSLAAAFYTLHQFRSQFIVDRYGMQKDLLGLYLSIPQAISFFSNILIGTINDRSGKQRLVMISLLMLSAFFFHSFFFSTDLVTFWIEFTFYFALISATLPLLDKFTVDYVAGIPEMGSKAFGSQRIWGTFGYLATNFAIEHVIKTSDSDTKNYSNMLYYNWAAVSIAAFFFYLFVKDLPRRHTSQNSFSSVKHLLTNLEYLYFIFIILLCGISRAFMTNYLGFYYSKVLKFEDQENTLNLFWPLNSLVDLAYEYKQATSTVFSVLLEIVIFFYSSLVTDKLGLFMPILLSQILQTLRFIGYYYLSYSNPNSFALCCLIELLKGASYSLIHISALQLANSLCPPHLKTTSQLFYNGTFVALGTILSGFVFMNFFSKGSDNPEQSYQEFHQAFKWNIIFSLLSMAFFVFKYGIYENLLFNRSNAERKMQQIEREARSEMPMEEETLIKKPVNVN